MTEIDQRIETSKVDADYALRVFSPAEIAKGVHRNFVGGRWDDLGRHQFDFLLGEGLQPAHTFVDVGCGSLRAGRHLIDYLDPGNYYGIDANVSLLQAGYDVELSDEQRSRMPIANLRANDRFDADFGVEFDMAIAQSVFTHISLNHIRLCLYRLAKSMSPGGRFFATFFEEPRSVPLDEIVNRPMQKQPRFSERNIYWYYRADLRWVAKSGPWDVRYVGSWGHPAGQRMIEFTRIPDDVWQARTRRPAPTKPNVVTRGRRWAARRISPD